VLGNLIGVQADGVSPLGNDSHGISFAASPSNTTIGSSAAPNRIAHNGDDGVSVATGSANRIRFNSIHSNANLGIDLAPNGVTPNDAMDSDSGPNLLQNYPTITGVTSIGGTTIVSRTFNGVANANITFDFYHSASCDSSGNGEGEVHFGSSTIMTDGAGNSNVNITFNNTPIFPGRVVTATATDAAGNTSEFSNCAEVPPLIVNTTQDPGDGTCTVGHCSLREAISAANVTTEPDVINFAIGSGMQTIQPTSALVISAPVEIDGTSQPGYADAPIIEISGLLAPAGSTGLNLTGGTGSTIRGLVLNRWQTSILLGPASSAARILGNYIGTDVAGTVDLGTGSDGIFVNDSDSNLIGGTGETDGNVISGNNGDGIRMNGAGATGNQVVGNIIGLDVTGTADLGNSGDGIDLNDSASSNIIGGATLEHRNIISGNGSDGVEIQGGGNTGNQVLGNFIGTNPDDATGLGNGGAGVNIVDSAPGNIIGGALRNVIARNSGAGVAIASGTTNQVLANAIYANGGLGIDLGSNGVTANDEDDPDSGANNLQNFPLLTSAGFDFDQVWINGTLNSVPSTTYTIQFFHNTACDASGNGEGALFSGSVQVTTNAGGDASFGLIIVPPGIANNGAFITATARSATGNTSEFSPCRQVLDDADDDNDGYPDEAESGAILCTLSDNDDGTAPVNDDALVNDGCPAVGASEAACADSTDNDADTRVNDGCPQAGTYSEGQFRIGTGANDPCGTNGWPSDFVSGSIPDSTNKSNIVDLTFFLAPTRKLDRSPGHANYNARLDLQPGKGAFGQWININDMTSLFSGISGSPPMFANTRAFDKICPWPP
jgi:CSLREA domain-containing protein